MSAPARTAFAAPSKSARKPSPVDATSRPRKRSIAARSLTLCSEEGIRLYPVEIRYAWPSELDLMARLAGLRLRERWGGWSGESFDASSGTHVSVYERAPRGKSPP